MRCQKNRNLLRRLNKKTNTILIVALCSLLSVSLFFTFMSCDRQEMLYGTWVLQTVLMNGEPLEDSLQFNLIPKYTSYTFFIMNSLTIRTIASGESITSPEGLYYFKDKSTIEMKYTLLYKYYEITAAIKKLNRQELHLQYNDNGNDYLLKLYSY
ncbi:MAG: hypothetical protein FWC10_07050 [Lentimicrobiaceae bacterium]|nr:hypothetical protein [Lentimicrobiaceae bacterium]